MATTGLVPSWRDGERLVVDVAGVKAEARRLKFEEQLVALRCWRGFYEVTQQQSPAHTPVVETYDQRSMLHENDPLLDDCLW